MKANNLINFCFALSISTIKLLILCILFKWYGISGYIILFLFERFYIILINKLYDLSYISLIDQIWILKEIFSSDIKIKEVIINDDLLNKFENVIEQIKAIIQIIDDKNYFFIIMKY